MIKFFFLNVILFPYNAKQQHMFFNSYCFFLLQSLIIRRGGNVDGNIHDKCLPPFYRKLGRLLFFLWTLHFIPFFYFLFFSPAYLKSGELLSSATLESRRCRTKCWRMNASLILLRLGHFCLPQQTPNKIFFYNTYNT